MTIRERLEAIRALHTGQPFRPSLCDTCDGEHILPCETYQLAVAALAQLDAAEIGYFSTSEQVIKRLVVDS